MQLHECTVGEKGPIETERQVPWKMARKRAIDRDERRKLVSETYL